MKQLIQYIYLETKRMFLSFPLIVLGSLLLLTILSGIFAFCQINSNSAKQRNTIKIGIVAAKDEPYVDWMITTVSNLKNTKYTCTFEHIDEQAANQKLQTGEIAIAFYIPKNYIASIVSGENKQLTIRMGSGQSTIINFIFKQLSEAASSFILNSEAGIYSMQEYYTLHHLPRLSEDEHELNLQYIKDIIALDKGIQIETINTANSYPLSSQYAIAGFVLFLLLCGLTSSKMLTSQSRTFHHQLALAGISQSKQILARGFSFLLIHLTNYLIFFLLIYIGMTIWHFALPDTMLSTPNGIWEFAARCFPLLLFSTAVIQLVYEITEDALGGILLLFFTVLILGLCSGCFYPLDYLPDSIQKLAPKLPIYQACQYGLSILYDTFNPKAFLCLTIYFVLCYFIMIISRTVRSRFTDY